MSFRECSDAGVIYARGVARAVIYATRGLLEVLLELAEEAEPEAVTVGLSVIRAGEFQSDLAVDDETPVFTHFYLPETGGSVNSVFGLDISTPMGQTQGRFVSHPDGNLEVTIEDDLHEVVLVAVPPWEQDSVAVFGRDGSRHELSVVDAEPPEERIV